jgi:hypothetical protein
MFVVAALLLIATSASCRSDGAQQTATNAATDATPGASDERLTDDVLEAAPFKAYSSFELAEVDAGYDIPRAGEEYPVTFGLTHLRWWPPSDVPLSSTDYDYPPLAPASFGISVAPESFWRSRSPDGQFLPRTGESTSIGGRDGWVRWGDTLWVFSYQCGVSRAGPLWCVVEADPDVGREAFEAFIESIEGEGWSPPRDTEARRLGAGTAAG